MACCRSRPFSIDVARRLGSRWDGFWALPSLFWIDASDAALRAVAWTGTALACAVVAGFANSLLLAALWALYMSIVHVGQEWYGYGWEIQLLETGFLAIFLVPLLDVRPFPRRAPPIAVIGLFRWLAFRIMLGAGLIKIRGDPVLARPHRALLPLRDPADPESARAARFTSCRARCCAPGSLFNHVAELVAPWFVFGPRWRAAGRGRRDRRLPAHVDRLRQPLVPELAHDRARARVPRRSRCWARVLPRALVRRAERARSTRRSRAPRCERRLVAPPSRSSRCSPSSPWLNLASPRQIMNTAFDRFDSRQHLRRVRHGRARAVETWSSKAPRTTLPTSARSGSPTPTARSRSRSTQRPVRDRALPAAARLADVVRRDGHARALSLDDPPGLEAAPRRSGRAARCSRTIRSPSARRAMSAPCSTAMRSRRPAIPTAAGGRARSSASGCRRSRPPTRA